MKRPTRRQVGIVAALLSVFIFSAVVVWVEFIHTPNRVASNEESKYEYLSNLCSSLNFAEFDDLVGSEFLSWEPNDSLSYSESGGALLLGRSHCVFESEARIEECGELRWIECIETIDDSREWPEDRPSNRIQVDISVYDSAKDIPNDDRLKPDSPATERREHFTMSSSQSEDPNYVMAIGLFVETNIEIKIVCRCVSSLYDDDFNTGIADSMHELSLQIADLSQGDDQE